MPIQAAGRRRAGLARSYINDTTLTSRVATLTTLITTTTTTTTTTTATASSVPHSPRQLSLPPQLQNAIPTCGQSCVQGYVDQEFSTCADNDFACLCAHYSSEGYTVGELTFVCLNEHCPSASPAERSLLYNICSAQTSAVSPTHSTLTVPATSTSFSGEASSSSLGSESPGPSSASTTSSAPSSLPVTAAGTGTTPSVAPTSSPSTATMPSQTASATSTASSHPSPALNSSQAVAVAIGSITGVAIILGIIWYVLRNRRRNRRQADKASKCDSYDFVDHASPRFTPSPYGGLAHPQGPGGGGGVAELHADVPVDEKMPPRGHPDPTLDFQFAKEVIGHGTPRSLGSPRSGSPRSNESLRTLSQLLPEKPGSTPPRPSTKHWPRPPSIRTPMTVFEEEYPPPVAISAPQQLPSVPRKPVPVLTLPGKAVRRPELANHYHPSPDHLHQPSPEQSAPKRASPPPSTMRSPPASTHSPQPSMMRSSQPSMMRSSPPSTMRSPPSTMHSPPPSTMRSPPPSTMHSPPHSTMHSPPPSTIHSPPHSTMRSPPPSTMRSPPPSTIRSPPPSTMRSPPPSMMHSPPPSTVRSPPAALLSPPVPIVDAAAPDHRSSRGSKAKSGASTAANSLLSYYASADADHDDGLDLRRSNPMEPPFTPISLEPQRRTKPVPSAIKVTKPTYFPRAVRQRSPSAGSDTSFESVGQDDPTPPEDDSKQLTPVTEHSPIAAIRYPKVPRSSNQRVSRSPPTQLSPRPQIQGDGRVLPAYRQRQESLGSRGGPRTSGQSQTNQSISSGSSTLAAKRLGDSAQQQDPQKRLVIDTGIGRVRSPPSKNGSDSLPLRNQPSTRQELPLKGYGRVTSGGSDYRSFRGSNGLLSPEMKSPVARVIRYGDKPGVAQEVVLNSPIWESKLTPSRRGDDLFLEFGLSSPVG